MQRKTQSRRAVNQARTKQAVRNAVAEVKDATQPRRKPPPKSGFSWLAAIGAGAMVVWKSWKAGKEPAPMGYDNNSATQLHAQLEREARQGSSGATANAKQQDNAQTSSNSRDTSIALLPQKPLESSGDTVPSRDFATNGQSGEHPARNAGASGNAPKVDDGPLALAKEFYKRFSEDEVMTRASALAFVGVFSLVPILLFAIIALGFIFRDPAEANRHVQNFVTQMLPGESASKAANDVLAQTHLVETAQDMTHHAGLPLVIGVGSLLWAGISLFVTATTPMNASWDVTETRNFFKLRVISLAVFLSAGLIFALSLVASALPGVVSSLGLPIFGAAGNVPFWIDILSHLIAIALDVAMFVIIYKLLPNAKVTWKAALFSGVITGLLWEAFKIGFGYYLTHFGANSNKMYGALGGVVLLITWIYYSCAVLLSGAEVGKMYHEHKEEGGVAQRTSRAI